jgi:hypothetical protein
MKILLVTEILTDPSLQVRPVNRTVVKEYSTVVDKLPPITVRDSGKSEYTLLDGFHRLEAHKLAGQQSIKAEVLTCSLVKAIQYIASCDTTVGLRRTLADRTRALDLLLKGGLVEDWSDRRIASHCGVSPTTVGKRRKALTSNPLEAPVTEAPLEEVAPQPNEVAVPEPLTSIELANLRQVMRSAAEEIIYLRKVVRHLTALVGPLG